MSMEKTRQWEDSQLPTEARVEGNTREFNLVLNANVENTRGMEALILLKKKISEM